jgi:hypothetical protein
MKINVFCGKDNKAVTVTKEQVMAFSILHEQFKTVYGVVEDDATATVTLEAGNEIESGALEQLLVILGEGELLRKATPSQLQRVGLVAHYLECRGVLHSVYKEMERRIHGASTYAEIRMVLNIFDHEAVSTDKIEEIKERVG